MENLMLNMHRQSLRNSKDNIRWMSSRIGGTAIANGNQAYGQELNWIGCITPLVSWQMPWARSANFIRQSRRCDR